MADSGFNPALLGIIDTGATITVGYSEYILGICDMYPELVHFITWADDKYTPIYLSGVNEDGGHKEENCLPAVVNFYMPYLTKNNQNTSFSIAIGKKVAVNVLIGMSFIRNTQLVIDTADGVAEAKMLQCNPFELIFKVASRGTPTAIPKDQVTDQTVFKSSHARDLMKERIFQTREFIENHEQPKANDKEGSQLTLRDAILNSEVVINAEDSVPEIKITGKQE